MVAAGTLIWISCRPLIRLVFCVACGVGITKADIFPATAASGAGQILLNITLPCLMFSKIVPAFTSQNVGALGPLVFVALLYEAIGILLAFTVKQFFWVPHRFRYGILVAGGWGNVGDIPTAVLMSITGAAPFQGVEDQNLAVAYISAFILVFLITLFPFGGHKWVAWDFAGPDVETEDVKEAMRLKRKRIFTSMHGYNPFSSKASSSETVEHTNRANVLSVDVEKLGTSENPPSTPYQRHPLNLDDGLIMTPTEDIRSPVTTSPPTELGFEPQIDALLNSLDLNEKIRRAPDFSSQNSAAPNSRTSNASRFPRIRGCIQWKFVAEFLKALMSPPSLAIIISFPIALIPKVKALFVEVPGTFMPSAPDGQPPLAFFLDSTNFVGAASVPLGLICLGSSLARLPFPTKGQWKMLPLGAISCIAIIKTLIMPVLGVLICQGLTNAGIIAKEDKVLRLVCIFLSCLPTATVQVLLTQVYSGTGSAEHLALFLIPQYILMFISMTAVIAFTIQLLF